MSAGAHPESDDLRRKCRALLEQLDAAGPWLSPESSALIELVTSLKAYHGAAKRMQRPLAARAACVAAVDACTGMDAEVRRSIAAALAELPDRPIDQWEKLVPLLEGLTAEAVAVTRLPDDAPVKGKVAAKRRLEDAGLRLLDAAGDVTSAGAVAAKAAVDASHKAAEQELAAESAKPAVEAAPVDAAAVEDDDDEIEEVVDAEVAPAVAVNAAPGTGPAPASAAVAASASAPAAGAAPASSSASGVVPAMGGDGRPGVRRLPVSLLAEFVKDAQVPLAVAKSLEPWLQKDPGDALPASWIIPGACPVTGSDVLVAFGGSRRELVFSRGGVVLKFEAEGVLVPA